MPALIRVVRVFPVDSTGNVVKTCYMLHAEGEDRCHYLLRTLKSPRPVYIVFEDQKNERGLLIFDGKEKFTDQSGRVVVLTDTEKETLSPVL